MSLNFNVDPYYDDFDPTKNFHRILFKPGAAVQARELTQSQSILQNQISNFADHIFSQNTPVSGGKVTTNLNAAYIKLQPQYQNTDITVSDFMNKEIIDSTGIVRAKVVAYAEANISNGQIIEYPTLIVNYYSGAQFSDNMVVYCADGSNTLALTIGITGGTTSIGNASTASISQGIFYVVNGYSNSSTPNQDGSYSKYSIGNFVSVSPQTTILSKYNNKPSYRVGLLINESVVTSIGDTSLLDPAVGASNYQAPGADRYQISLELIALPLTLGNDSAFIELLRIDNGTIVKQVDGTVYSVIDDYFAKRDYETNGDYVVNDFKLTPVANTINSAQFDIKVGKGLAYIHGYRVENQSDILLTDDRARTTTTINNNGVFFDYGNYLIVSSVKGTFDITTSPKVDLHCVANANVVSTNTTTYNSTLVGSGYIRNLQYVTSASSGNTSSYVYNAYLADLSTNILTGNATSATATTIQFYDVNGTFSNTSNAYINATLALTGGSSVGDRRTIIAYNGTTKTANVNAPFTVTPDSTTTFSIVFETADIESLVTRNSSNSIIATANIDPTGKVNGLSTGDTILNNPNTPELIFPVGAPFVANVSNSNYVTTRVFRNKSFTTLSGLSTLVLTIPTSTPESFIGNIGTLSGDVIKQNYTVIDRSTGKILDFVSSGNVVSITSNTKQQVTFTSTTYSNPTVDVIADINVSNADNTTTILKIKNLVVGNTTVASVSGPSGIIASNTYVDLTNGQVYIKRGAITTINSLYVSDVKRITKVIDSKDPTVAVTSAMLTNPAYDVTSKYVLNNGQKDSMYDHASVNLVAGANLPVGNLLVVFDFYAHVGGDGYFNVNSYLSPKSTSPEDYASIPTYTSKNGTVYRLADCIDFRPVRKNAQSAMTFEYTGNPTSDDTGILIPQNLTEYYSNYAYYLGRKDKLVLTKDNNFQIVKGTPSTSPIYPTEPDGALVIANLTLDPYTAYIPGEAPGQVNANLSIEKVLHKNWIKSDITDLQNRVNNLEYYSSLNLLEQNAQSLQVPDVNGLNRFKNGILVDDFSSFSTADTGNPDFQANINTRKRKLGPLNIVDNFALQNPIVLNSLGTLSNTNYWAVSSIQGTHTNVFTLPYTKANVIVQPIATSTVSVNPFGVVINQGLLQLNPPMDNWVDNNQAPSVIVTDPSLKIFQQTNGVNLLNAGDWKTIPGTLTTTTSTTGPIEGHGINPSPFGFVGYTATTTSTYASQLQNVTAAGYSPVSSTVGTNNGYLTNIAVLPYIRAQQLIFRAKGLLINAPLTTTFDGVNVDQYITTPNTVELVNVSGTFNEDDVIGFYTANQFFPTGRVVAVYKYPGTTSVRLYLSTLLAAPSYSTTNVIQNALFDSNGTYKNSTASGTINSSNAVTPLSTSGVITGVGGKYNPIDGGAASNIYKVQDANDWGTFLNQYGVWGDPNQSLTYNFSVSANIATTGTYTVTASASYSAAIKVDGTTILTVANPKTTSACTMTITAGSHTFGWNATNNSTANPAAVAVVIKDSNGNLIFQSTIPPATSYDNVTQETIMPKGGALFTGVTKLALDSKASSNSNYYVGATLNIQTKYVYAYTTETATYVPPPPSRGRGGRCFTEDTLVLMADGTEKKIKDVKVGDVIFNRNKKMLNVVMFVEKTLDTNFMELYSPTKKLKPFATINHPIYIDDELCSPISEEIYNLYPWLGRTKQIEAVSRVPAKGNIVYNLWVDGDGTFIVNGYGTTSIIGDGGVLRTITEKGMFTPQEASDILIEFAKTDKETCYGAYLMNKLFEDVDNNLVNHLFVRALKNDDHPITKKIVMTSFKIIGKIACIINNK